MKKVGLWLLVVALCFSLTACIVIDSEPKKEPAGNSGETSTTEAPETTFGLNEAAVFDTLKFTATEIKESKGVDFFEPEKGNVFVGVKFTIENISDEEETVSTLLLFDGYADDVKCAYSVSAACAFDEGTLDGSIAPSKKLVGWYALEVPKDWKTVELNVQSNWLSSNAAKFVFKK